MTETVCWVCRTCGDTGRIWRPPERVRHMVSLRDADGDFARQGATTVLGGVDACPVCAAVAEADWNTGIAEWEAK